MDFFDNAFTNSKNTSNVTCCHPDNTFNVVTCGQGVSCSGQCSALSLEASLCPSGNCNDDPNTCQVEFSEPGETTNLENQGSGVSPANGISTDYKWCITDGCPVRDHKECCYHPYCETRNRDACKWLDYLTGKGSTPQILYNSEGFFGNIKLT